MEDNIKEYTWAVANNSDMWVSSAMGTETPFYGRDGRRYLYVYNPFRQRHGYYDIASDIVIDDMEWSISPR